MQRTGHGPKTIAALLPRITDKALRKRGFATDAVITRWAEIVGPQLAADTAPYKMAFPRRGQGEATLHIRAAGASATEIQHMTPMLIERINTFFGYRAVARLVLVQGPLPAPPDRARTRPRRALDASEERAIAERVADVEDDSLRDALARLGRAVKSADKAARKGNPVR